MSMYIIGFSPFSFLLELGSNLFILSIRHFWVYVLKHTKRQVVNQSFSQHALLWNVYNRGVYTIFVNC